MIVKQANAATKAEFLANTARPQFAKLGAAEAVDNAIQRIMPVADLTKYREAAIAILQSGL